jgi:outer membrane protein TolC
MVLSACWAATVLGQQKSLIPTELTLADAVAIYQQHAAEARLDDAQGRGLCAVKQAFYEAVFAQYLIGEAECEAQYFDELLEIAQARSEVGAAPESDTTKVIFERDRVRLSLAEAKAQLRQSVIRLVSLLGAPASGPLPDVTGNLTINPLNLDLAELAEMALRQHPNARAELQDATRTQVFAAVESSFAAWTMHRERAEAMQSGQIGRASDLQAIAHTLYFEKQGGLLNLFEARHARRAVRQRYFRALLDSHLSLAQLESAVGRPLATILR